MLCVCWNLVPGTCQMTSGFSWKHTAETMVLSQKTYCDPVYHAELQDMQNVHAPVICLVCIFLHHYLRQLLRQVVNTVSIHF